MSTVSLRKAERESLDSLAKKSRDGKLHPKSVVEAARDPKHPLHPRFEWNNSKAAFQFRLEQARDLIQAYVTYVPHSTAPVRAYVAVRNGNDGYTQVERALKSEEVTEKLIAQFKSDLMEVLRRYNYLRGHCHNIFIVVEALTQPERQPQQEGDSVTARV